ncbi:helix-turn-helix domain-containing protein [Streptomyces sp. NPDC015131]|uniref:helix-turn-helix domain-containing protein n=1 Tax=Streptomyces sp. NPDC015131 TaxID=3364941 RepID=UPI0036FD256C
MRVYRTAPTRAFTTFSNALLRDATISWCAVGLLAYLVSLPNGARASIRKLSEQRKEGRDRIAAALRELEDARYLRRLTRRDRTGQLRTEYEVFDTPYDPEAPAPGPSARPAAGPAAAPAPAPAAAPAPGMAGNPASGDPDHGAPGPLPPGEKTGVQEPPSPAVRLLTSLGRSEPRLALGAGEAERLRTLVEEWWAVGASDALIREALTSGLPARVHAPAALVADRLRRKKPAPRPAAPVRPECGVCGVPVPEGASCARCEPATPAVAGFVAAALRGGASVRQVLRRR